MSNGRATQSIPPRGGFVGVNHAQLLHLREDVHDPQVSEIRPPVMRKMKISSYATDLPVGGRPMYAPWCVPVTELDELIEDLRDQVRVAGVGGVTEAPVRRFVGLFLDC